MSTGKPPVIHGPYTGSREAKQSIGKRFIKGQVIFTGTYQAAIRMLTRRDHSAFEVYEKLHAKNHNEEDITEVIKLLVTENLISDKRFAIAYTQMRVKKGFGPNKIRLELRNRGIDRDLIDSEIANFSKSWSQNAAQAIEKKYGPSLPAEWREKARQARFLQARGFLSQHIHDVLKLNDP